MKEAFAGSLYLQTRIWRVGRSRQTLICGLYFDGRKTRWPWQIAVKARCSIRTVSNVLRIFRDYGKVKDPFRQYTPSKLSEADLKRDARKASRRVPEIRFCWSKQRDRLDSLTQRGYCWTCEQRRLVFQGRAANEEKGEAITTGKGTHDHGERGCRRCKYVGSIVQLHGHINPTRRFFRFQSVRGRNKGNMWGYFPKYRFKDRFNEQTLFRVEEESPGR